MSDHDTAFAMNVKRALQVISGLLLVALGSAIWYWRTSEDRTDEEHYRRGETLVVVSNLSLRPIRLLASRAHLGDTVTVSAALGSPGGEALWLPPGNYFLRVQGDMAPCYYPLPLTGYHSGPDREGSYLLTVRPLPERTPPRLDESAPAYAYIPSGNFLIGDRQNPRERHHVWLTAYFIAPFEVSNAEFRRFLDAPDGYGNARWWTKEGGAWANQGRSQCSALLNANDPYYERFGRADQPVTWVTWFEANAFCRWLTKQIGEGTWQYALPTDAEWEKAARGPDNFDYGLGMTISDAEVGLYNWKKNPSEPVTVVGLGHTIGQYQANRYGLYHMTGNVAEWTQSLERPFSRERPYLDDDRNADDGVGKRTVRGGSWYSASIAYLYIPYRDSFQPSHRTQDVGFRIVAHALP